MIKKANLRASLLLGLALALTACATGAVAPTTAAQPSPTTGATGGVTVRVAMLPILDSLPMYVAIAQGYFAAQNIKVQVVPVASAAERDQLMQAGQADAMINDLVSTLFYNKVKTTLTVVRFARPAGGAERRNGEGGDHPRSHRGGGHRCRRHGDYFRCGAFTVWQQPAVVYRRFCQQKPGHREGLLSGLGKRRGGHQRRQDQVG